MKVKNNIVGKGTEDISKTLQEIFESRNGHEHNLFPLIFVKKYTKDEKTGNIVEHQMYGLLNDPVVIYNEADEGDIHSYISTRQGQIYYKKGDDLWTKIKSPIELANSSKIIDVEKYSNGNLGRRDVTANLPKGENVVLIYLGNSAADLLDRLHEQ